MLQTPLTHRSWVLRRNKSESLLPSGPSAQPDLSAPPLRSSSPLMECLFQTRAAPLPASAAIKRFDFFLLFKKKSIFLAAELSWSSGEELNVHTLPPSRGGEEEEVTAGGSLTPVSNWEIWITLVKLHWYKHPLSSYIFLFYTLFSHFNLTAPKVI